MDYKALLETYMKHVILEEGYSFLDRFLLTYNVSPDKTTTVSSGYISIHGVHLSQDEYDELQRIAEEANQ